MDVEPKLERHVRANAFVAALASAAGQDETAHEYLDRMMRAWALLAPVEDAAIFGAAGEW